MNAAASVLMSGAQGAQDVVDIFGFIRHVGQEIADVVQVITQNDVGAFLIGLYVVATIFHLVWGKVRNG
jgi:hypothetical protein